MTKSFTIWKSIGPRKIDNSVRSDRLKDDFERQFRLVTDPDGVRTEHLIQAAKWYFSAIGLECKERIFDSVVYDGTHTSLHLYIERFNLYIAFNDKTTCGSYKSLVFCEGKNVAFIGLKSKYGMTWPEFTILISSYGKHVEDGGEMNIIDFIKSPQLILTNKFEKADFNKLKNISKKQTNAIRSIIKDRLLASKANFTEVTGNHDGWGDFIPDFYLSDFRIYISASENRNGISNHVGLSNQPIYSLMKSNDAFFENIIFFKEKIGDIRRSKIEIENFVKFILTEQFKNKIMEEIKWRKDCEDRKWSARYSNRESDKLRGKSYVFSEANMEDSIVSNPSSWGFEGWSFVERQVNVAGHGRLDVLLRKGQNYKVVEIQRGRLDKSHFSKVSIYRLQLSKDRKIDLNNISMALVANRVSDTIKEACISSGIEVYEVSDEDAAKKIKSKTN